MSDLWSDPNLTTANGEHTAADDYPELSEVVGEHLPPEIYRAAALRRTQAGVGDWMRNQVVDFVDDGLLRSDTNWCRYRSRDGHCHLPGALDLDGTRQAGYAVWQVVDRGACVRTWPEQMGCPIGEAGPDVGGAPSPVNWNEGGQRVQITPMR